MNDAVELPLHRLAHARTGDKGNRINVAVFCREPAFYPYLDEQLTEQAVWSVFEHRRPSRIVRHRVPNLSAFNFVIDDVLEGGVNNSLYLDRHGKGLSFLLLAMQVRVPRHCLGEALETVSESI